MEIVSLITNDQHYGLVNWLEPSCKFLGHELKALCVDIPYHSHKIKDLALLQYIKTLKKDTILLFTDAYDAMLMGNESEILKKFQSFQSPLVFSAEINCYPNDQLKTKYPPEVRKHHFKYLNCGGFIGYSYYIRKLIEEQYFNQSIDLNNHYMSNQLMWHQIYLKENGKIKLDHNCDIFYTFASNSGANAIFHNRSKPTERDQVLEFEKKKFQNEIMVKDDRMISLITGTQPCHLHFPGPLTQHLLSMGFFDHLRFWENKLNRSS